MPSRSGSLAGAGHWCLGRVSLVEARKGEGDATSESPARLPHSAGERCRLLHGSNVGLPPLSPCSAGDAEHRVGDFWGLALLCFSMFANPANARDDGQKAFCQGPETCEGQMAPWRGTVRHGGESKCFVLLGNSGATRRSAPARAQSLCWRDASHPAPVHPTALQDSLPLKPGPAGTTRAPCTRFSSAVQPARWCCAPNSSHPQTGARGGSQLVKIEHDSLCCLLQNGPMPGALNTRLAAGLAHGSGQNQRARMGPKGAEMEPGASAGPCSWSRDVVLCREMGSAGVWDSQVVQGPQILSIYRAAPCLLTSSWHGLWPRFGDSQRESRNKS